MLYPAKKTKSGDQSSRKKTKEKKKPKANTPEFKGLKERLIGFDMF